MKFRPRNLPLLLGTAVLATVVLIYLSVHPRGLSSFVVQSYANSAAPLAFAAIAQTFPVLTGGLDLSIGGIIALTNTLASELVHGSPLEVIAGIVIVLGVGAACGAFNGALITYGRIQPIIATLASGAIFSGLALFIRPFPGGDVSVELADAATGMIFAIFPVCVAAIAALLWLAGLLLNRTLTGKGIFAAGSAPNAATLSGLRIDRSIMAAYIMSGIFGALAGLFLGFQTLSGDATIGVPYTINSIAAVVIGGLSLRGGRGSLLSGVIGAFALRGIGAVLLFSGSPPLAQPLLEGMVLIVAVCAASITLVRQPNRLNVFS
ncbi:MAG: ABC transporter permease [Mesorhizobium sp.]|uniref:ABC transporter permease n=1 Tax=Mesorhizobium sp. TaxID=1871066 RepID=UPI000FE8DB23|nr:ABC transporter permease [Mesorhizobium sp.]RWM88735.1 MAG: ABC transporter permease [Mesorhizobium sp.]